jgi:hypothetical protein
MISILTRISLIGLIIFGGYMVFAEQRIIRVCENEVKSLEKVFETRLDPRSSTIEFRSLSRTDPQFFSWLYHAPPNKSFAIQILSKESNEMSTTTLLRIPSQPTGHYGIIDIQFNSEGTSPPLIKQLEVYGPNFLKAEQSTGKDSHFMSPRFLGLVVSDKADVFAASKEQVRSTFYYLAKQQQSTTHPCRPGVPVALCYFTEQETAGAPLMHREFIIWASADD